MKRFFMFLLCLLFLPFPSRAQSPQDHEPIANDLQSVFERPEAIRITTSFIVRQKIQEIEDPIKADLTEASLRNMFFDKALSECESLKEKFKREHCRIASINIHNPAVLISAGNGTVVFGSGSVDNRGNSVRLQQMLGSVTYLLKN